MKGPFMKLDSNDTQTVVFHIPSGERYKDYRLKQGSVIQRASVTIRYVEANNSEDYQSLVAVKNSTQLQAKLTADFGNVVSLGTLDGGVQSSREKSHQEEHVQRVVHAGLVLFGKTEKNGLGCKESNKSIINVQLEICVEKTEEAPPVTPYVPPTRLKM